MPNFRWFFRKRMGSVGQRCLVMAGDGASSQAFLQLCLFLEGGQIDNSFAGDGGSARYFGKDTFGDECLHVGLLGAGLERVWDESTGVDVAI
jgi:hypothetical protein